VRPEIRYENLLFLYFMDFCNQLENLFKKILISEIFLVEKSFFLTNFLRFILEVDQRLIKCFAGKFNCFIKS
jgi:hypothetical protein